jgi:hypothetical protein
MTDIKGLRAAMHAAVDSEQASADEMIRQVMRRHRRHRRRLALAGVAALIALAVAVPVAIAVHGALPGSGPRPPLQHPTPRPHRLPTKMTGLPMPAGTNFQLLISAGDGAAWYSTATRRADRIGGLPRSQGGYQFSLVYGGWIALPNNQTWSSSCPPHGIDACAGRPSQFFFIADGSRTATRIGAGFWADGVVASSRPGAVWLATYPRATAKLIGSGYAQLVSTTGRPLGPRYRLPANYLLGSGVGSYLLLVNNKQQNQFILWDPGTGRVLRHFGNVIATGPEQIAWSRGCRGCRVQILNVSTGTTVTLPIPGRNPASLNATFSDDGRLLAVQAPGREIEVYDTGSRTLTAIPGTAVNSGDWQNFAWHAVGHRLVIAAGAGTAQLAYWQPGDTALRVATVRNFREYAVLQTGQFG